MPNILKPVQSPADVRQNVQTFNIEAAQFYDRAARLLRETTYWVYDPMTESFGPSKFVGFAEMSFDRYVRAVAGESEGARFDGGVTQAAISGALGTSYREDQNLRARLETWGMERFGPDAFGGADRQKWRFVSLPAVTETARPRLSLDLHGRYTRADVYALFGIDYDARRTRHLNVGLSPRMPDGGYQLFITLDKETLAPDYDYEDILFQDQLIWVTRRGADQDDEDYDALRDPATRLSLFLRGQNKESFAYLGEARAAGHEQFSNQGRVQQRYNLALQVPVPDALFAELTAGNAKSRGVRAGTSDSGVEVPVATTARPSRPSGRRPATLDEYQRAYRYVLGTAEREVLPAHQHYQMWLRAHFEARSVSAEWERDFVDVRWEYAGQSWIGEVKLTRYLAAAEAFRAALGQLLVYGATQFAEPPRMVMFLDQSPGERLLRLAERLGVAVVVETSLGAFELHSAPLDSELAGMFSRSQRV